MDAQASHRAIMLKVERMVGYVPVGMSDLLTILRHPDVIDLARAYLDATESDAR